MAEWSIKEGKRRFNLTPFEAESITEDEKKMAKIVSDTRDPFLVKQLESEKQNRIKVQKERDKYSKEINEIAAYLGCYGCSEAIIKSIEKYKNAYHTLKTDEMTNKFRFIFRRFFRFLVKAMPI